MSLRSTRIVLAKTRGRGNGVKLHTIPFHLPLLVSKWKMEWKVYFHSLSDKMEKVRGRMGMESVKENSYFCSLEKNVMEMECRVDL